MFVDNHKYAQCHTLVAHELWQADAHSHFFTRFVFELCGFSCFRLSSSCMFRSSWWQTKGSDLCVPPFFPLSLPSPETRGERQRRRGWRGGERGGRHSIGTPRHSKGNHPKYFPLSVARASRLLLHIHTHIHTVWESAKSEYTHTHWEKVLLMRATGHLCPHVDSDCSYEWLMGILYVRLLLVWRATCCRCVCLSVCLQQSQIRKGHCDCCVTPTHEFMNERASKQDMTTNIRLSLSYSGGNVFCMETSLLEWDVDSLSNCFSENVNLFLCASLERTGTHEEVNEKGTSGLMQW